MKGQKSHQVGDVRPSQLLLTYGVGALIDLPYISALIMGLDEWNTKAAEEIVEERLLQSIQSVLGPQVKRLLAPPADESSALNSYSTVGVPVAAFPRWMVCPACRHLASVDSGYFEIRTNIYHPDQTRYVHVNCAKPARPAALPSRFMIACEGGHLDDFPWVHFVHGATPCNSSLRMREIGVSGTPSDIIIECTICGKRRSMAEAFKSSEEDQTYMPDCTGRSPHLRKIAKKKCQYPARTTLLAASNTWFPLVYTALALPTAEDPVSQLVDEHWSILQGADSVERIRSFLYIPQIKESLGGYNPETIWQRVEKKQQKTTSAARPADLKLPEWQVLSNPQQAPHTDDFEVTSADVPPEYADALQQVVLVERLREVRALTGFTRIESLSDYAEDEELPKDHIMQLANQGPNWVPASEVRGEGLFLHFREAAIQRWLSELPVKRHNEVFHDAHHRWRKARRLNPEINYPEIRYVLLHTFAHALMRQLALESGYAAASIRERIYSQGSEKEGGAMAGILLYTAASDSEGTLGGLVNLGKNLGSHIAGALETMQYCASDPLCAEHASLEDRTLHGAACHACMFIPETSCEIGNKYLDRSVLIRTIERDNLAFFKKIEG
ncbi:MAG: DUF1998 domain-containing protein [Ktedonobacteraceae bacterium]